MATGSMATGSMATASVATTITMEGSQCYVIVVATLAVAMRAPMGPLLAFATVSP
jgi:hypothetical protein